jgi:hypothetical protein
MRLELKLTSQSVVTRMRSTFRVGDICYCTLAIISYLIQIIILVEAVLQPSPMVLTHDVSRQLHFDLKVANIDRYYQTYLEYSSSTITKFEL